MSLPLPVEPGVATPVDAGPPVVGPTGCAIAAPPRANAPITAAIACTFMIASPKLQITTLELMVIVLVPKVALRLYA
jgi:hypothetical protein